MSRITLAQAAQWCGGTVDPKYAQISFLGASNDSRSVKPGQLFVALEGVRDGHDFIPAALAAGAAAVLCSHSGGDFPAIVVKDTRKALGDIAREERKRLNVKVVGVTGSVGKSTSITRRSTSSPPSAKSSSTTASPGTLPCWPTMLPRARWSSCCLPACSR